MHTLAWEAYDASNTAASGGAKISSVRIIYMGVQPCVGVTQWEYNTKYKYINIHYISVLIDLHTVPHLLDLQKKEVLGDILNQL